MIQSERFQRIEELSNERGIVNTSEMALLLGVTETTIRRDFEELEQLGKIVRVHGGAKGIKKKRIVTTGDEKVIAQRTERAREKDAVCRRAASFVKDRACVFLDGGSSVAPIVKYLADKDVIIVTNSMTVANAFQGGMAQMILVGGSYVPKYSMTIGSLAVNEVAKFNFDYSFISCIGADIGRKMIYTAEVDTMAVKEAVIGLTSTNILLLDSSKLYVKGFYSLSSLDTFDFVICNEDDALAGEELPENFILEKV